MPRTFPAARFSVFCHAPDSNILLISFPAAVSAAARMTIFRMGFGIFFMIVLGFFIPRTSRFYFTTGRPENHPWFLFTDKEMTAGKRSFLHYIEIRSGIDPRRRQFTRYVPSPYLRRYSTFGPPE